ncbi:hypothetical protein BTVI_42119 [Pitangus sulphuratus]|nr:hypothetical protein BTVI_42119 [Pitangus sulphuratus]
MPAGSKRDMLLAKAEPFRSDSNTSVIIVKNKQSYCTYEIAAREKNGVRTCEKNSSADTKVSGEGGGGGAPEAGAEIPLPPVVQTTLAVVPLQPMEVHGGPGDAEIHLQPMEETHAGAGRCPRQCCDPTEGPCWSRLLTGTCWPMERECCSRFTAVHGEHPWDGFMLEEFMEDCLLWDVQHTGVGEGHFALSSGRNNDELVMTPTTHLPVLLERRQQFSKQQLFAMSQRLALRQDLCYFIPKFKILPETGLKTSHQETEKPASTADIFQYQADKDSERKPDIVLQAPNATAKVKYLESSHHSKFAYFPVIRTLIIMNLFSQCYGQTPDEDKADGGESWASSPNPL